MSLDASSSSRREWILGNPWFWSVLGLAFAGFAWTWLAFVARNPALGSLGAAADEYPGGRFALVVAALVAAGVAVTLRLNSSLPPYFQHFARRFRRTTLRLFCLVFAVIALGMTAWLVCSFFELAGVTDRWGPLLLWWIVVAPVCAVAAAQCWSVLSQNQPLTERDESAILLLLAALTCFVCGRALFDREDPLQLDTLRFFLSVLTMVPLLGAAVVLVPREARRNFVSVLVLIHFGAILTATMSAPPQSWIAGQIWTRLYRPYLEFMYLNNAYHFYAPDPGPATYLWCRILYEDDKGQALGKWYKVPMVDERGYQQHPVGLAYQRHLAITEVFTGSDLPAIFYEIDNQGYPIVGANGNVVSADFYVRRIYNSPIGFKFEVLGKERPRFTQVIPFHPALTQVQQYKQPSTQIKTIMKSFARHVLDVAQKDPDLEKSGLTVTGVKIYRVIHPPASQDTFLSGALEPNDPQTFWPFFYGEYDVSGELADPLDPFLYWLLPTLQFYDHNGRPHVISYALKHAGDPLCVRGPDKKWIEEPHFISNLFERPRVQKAAPPQPPLPPPANPGKN